jgi:hypothetical protein
VAKREIAERIDGQLTAEVSHRVGRANGAHKAASDSRALRWRVVAIGEPQLMQVPRPAGARGAPLDSVRAVACSKAIQNIRDRVEDLGGTLKLASGPGRGTVLRIALPWPAAADGRR